MMLDSNTQLGLKSLVVFRNLLDDKVISKLIKLTDIAGDSYLSFVEDRKFLKRYSEIMVLLCEKNLNLSEYIFNLVLDDDNFYIRKILHNEPLDESLDVRADYELRLLQTLSRVTIKLEKRTNIAGYRHQKHQPRDCSNPYYHYNFINELPEWQTSEIDFVSGYHEHIPKLVRENEAEEAKRQ